MPEEKPGLEEGWYWVRWTAGPWQPMCVFGQGQFVRSKDLVYDVAYEGIEIGPRLHPPQESPANQQKGRDS